MPNENQKRIEDALDLARSQGFTVEHRSGGHVQVKAPDGEQMAHFPSTAGKGRAWRNAEAKLRQIGVDMGDRQTKPEEPVEEPEEKLALHRCTARGCAYTTSDKSMLALHKRLHKMKKGATVRDRLLAVLLSDPHKRWKRQELSALTGADLPTISATLSRMIQRGDAVRPAQGEYSIIAQPEQSGNGQLEPLSGAPWSTSEMPEHEREAFDQRIREMLDATAPGKATTPKPHGPTDPGALLEVLAWGPQTLQLVLRDESGTVWIATKL